jgi:arylsulfatase A-like enzyme
MSVLAGKSPITTKLIYPPDIFHGRDAYEHLPNILARLGYYTVDLNDGYFASTSKSNLRDGFHVENGQETDFATGLGFRKRLEVAFSQERYLLTDLYERHGSRLFYMIRPTFQPDHSARFMFTEEDPQLEDAELIEIANKILRTTDRPVFVHLHLLGTHGPTFSPRYCKFSTWGDQEIPAGRNEAIEEQRRSYYSGGTIPQDEFALLFSSKRVSPARQKKEWDLYDDAIFSGDHYFGEIVETLRETGKLKNSMIIFMTDHGMGLFTTSLDKIRHPLPLVVYLPGQKEKTVVDEPVQYLDIAPSILAFLRQPIPEWMEGDVIFGEGMEGISIPERAIVTAGAYGNKLVMVPGRGLQVQKSDAGPPHYGIDLLGLLFEEKFFLYSPHLKTGNLYDIHEGPYIFRSIDSAEQKQQYHERLRTHVETKGIGID